MTLHLDADLGRLPEPIELSIFRIVQEGLNNVRKHAQTSELQVALKRTSPRTLLISIADDGQRLAADFDLSDEESLTPVDRASGPGYNTSR